MVAPATPWPPEAATHPSFASKSFADLFLPKHSQPLLLKQHTSYCGENAVNFSSEEIHKLSSPFKFALIGKFSRGRPSLDDIRKFFKTLDLKASVFIGLLDYRHVLIRCSVEADFLRLWARNIWFVKNFAMRIFRWTHDFHVDHESSLTPVWFSLPKLPIHFFSKEAIFSIVSALGRPLLIDSATATLSRPSVARVLVEVDLMKVLPDRVWIGYGENLGFWQSLQSENLPPYCRTCLHVGHLEQHCRLKLNKDNSSVPENPFKKQIFPVHTKKLNQVYRPVRVSGNLNNDDQHSVIIQQWQSENVILKDGGDVRHVGPNERLLLPQVCEVSDSENLVQSSGEDQFCEVSDSENLVQSSGEDFQAKSGKEQDLSAELQLGGGGREVKVLTELHGEEKQSRVLEFSAPSAQTNKEQSQDVCRDGIEHSAPSAGVRDEKKFLGHKGEQASDSMEINAGMLQTSSGASLSNLDMHAKSSQNQMGDEKNPYEQNDVTPKTVEINAKVHPAHNFVTYDFFRNGDNLVIDHERGSSLQASLMDNLQPSLAGTETEFSDHGAILNKEKLQDLSQTDIELHAPLSHGNPSEIAPTLVSKAEGKTDTAPSRQVAQNPVVEEPRIRKAPKFSVHSNMVGQKQVTKGDKNLSTKQTLVDVPLQGPKCRKSCPRVEHEVDDHSQHLLTWNEQTNQDITQPGCPSSTGAPCELSVTVREVHNKILNFCPLLVEGPPQLSVPKFREEPKQSNKEQLDMKDYLQQQFQKDEENHVGDVETDLRCEQSGALQEKISMMVDEVILEAANNLIANLADQVISEDLNIASPSRLSILNNEGEDCLMAEGVEVELQAQLENIIASGGLSPRKVRGFKGVRCDSKKELRVSRLNAKRGFFLDRTSSANSL